MTNYKYASSFSDLYCLFASAVLSAFDLFMFKLYVIDKNQCSWNFVRLFLMGLKKYGKGDWRNISRNFVVTRTPTQVASHAQKYFIRQLSGGKDKRRASIHDITTVNLNDMRTPSPDNKGTPSPEQSSVLTQQPNSAPMPRTHFQWNPPCGGATMAFNSTQGSMSMSSPYGIPSYGLTMQGQSLQRSAAHESYFGPQNLVFQMQSTEQYPQNHLF